MLMKKKCDAEVNYRTMGGRRFGLTGRAQDHLVLCSGLEQPNVLFLYSFLDHWQVYSGIFLLHFHGFQKSACRLFPEPETMSLIVQVGFSFQNLLIQCICWRQHVVLLFDWHKSSWDFIFCILPHRILNFYLLKECFFLLRENWKGKNMYGFAENRISLPTSLWRVWMQRVPWTKPGTIKQSTEVGTGIYCSRLSNVKQVSCYSCQPWKALKCHCTEKAAQVLNCEEK